ncbi:hypothetical protein U1Q18_017282, partial [Sarracenia purpurea var. burkii]
KRKDEEASSVRDIATRAYGEGAFPIRNTCHRLGKASTQDRADPVARRGRGATGQYGRGSRGPIVEEVSTIKEVYQLASMFDEGNTGT